MSVRDGVILLAEDDPNDVLSVQRAFQRNYVANPVQVVRDGEEALAYLSGQAPFADRERHPLPVLMLMDLKMPRKSGLEVLEWVRRQTGLKRFTIIVMTSSNQSHDNNRANELVTKSEHYL